MQTCYRFITFRGQMAKVNAISIYINVLTYLKVLYGMFKASI